MFTVNRSYPLEVRKTNKYNDGWSYLDEWETIGEYEIIAHGPAIFEDDSYEDSFSQVLLAKVQVDGDVEVPEVDRAISASLSGTSCQHEHDCCGCYSYYAKATHLKDDRWEVLYSGSRNY